MTIRSAETSDVEAVAALHRRTALFAFAHIFPAGAPQPELRQLIVDWTSRIGSDRWSKQSGFVAETDGGVIGVVVAGPVRDAHICGHVSRLYVDPDHWRQGIGTMLHHRALAHLRLHDFRRATLWVLEANTRARAWYEHLGWRLNGERLTTYAPAGIDDVGYERSL
jgi:ribosomal protein S18 acetylase RimI-like enzyme